MSLLRTLRFVSSHPLSRDHRLAAIWRFAKWQLTSRFAAEPVPVPFVGASRLLMRRGMTGATGNLYVGLHEYEGMAFVLHFLRPGDLFVDVGANVGAYTVLASAVVGARSLAFEPVAPTFASLLENVRMNGIEDKVEAHCAALGGESGERVMTADLDCANHVIPAGGEYSGTSTRVPVMRLDDVLADRAPALMKIDVEGFEREVLAGAGRVLGTRSLSAIILEPFADGKAEGGSEAILAQFGFRVCSYVPTTRQLLEGRTADAREYRTGGNLLFVRDPAEAQARLHSAPRFVVLGKSL